MMQKTIAMPRRKTIALVAHDNKKEELVGWAKSNGKTSRFFGLLAMPDERRRHRFIPVSIDDIEVSDRNVRGTDVARTL